MEYLTPQQVYKKFGYHPRTTADWADAGKIDCVKSPGGHRRYPITAFTGDNTQTREVILYARVSTHGQKDDLVNQINALGMAYPQTRVIKDIASGLNWKRKGFKKLMLEVHEGKVSKIVVGHKDRLCRFGFEFVEWFCELYDCELVVLDSAKLSPHEELMKDFMAIMHCFSSKLYFLRAYKKKIEDEEGVKVELKQSECESM